MTAEHHPTTDGARMVCTCGRRLTTPTQYAARALAELHAANPEQRVLIAVVNGEHRLFCSDDDGFELGCDSAETAQRIAARHLTNHHQE